MMWLVISACGLTLSLLIMIWLNWRRNQEIKKLADYVRRMASGEEIYDIRDNTEGSLSILKSDIYKLVRRLSEQTNLLRAEKIKLKETLFDVSHQLKTPITSMTMMVDLLEQKNLPEKKRQEFIDNLQTSLARMDWLVKSLLKLARLDTEAESLKMKKVAVDELIENSTYQLAAIFKKKKQKLEIETEPNLMIKADLNWTTEALSNILKNASEHTPVGGKINLTAGQSSINTWIKVVDAGSGIAAADLPHLFQRFYKGHGATKDSIGIGLAMSLAIMQKQNGDIEVQTAKNQGSTFILKFYK